MMGKQPAPGLFLPDSEGEPLSRSDVSDEGVKGTRELKMPDITGKRSEFRKNDKSRALGLPTGRRFIFQNRYLENCVLRGAVCVWVLVMGLRTALWDR